MTHLLEAGDEVGYSIHVSGGFQLKKFGVNLIYENDKKDYQSYFEAMIQNAYLPYKDDFLHEDVSKDQAMAGDKKIHPSYVQVNFYNLGKIIQYFGTILSPLIYLIYLFSEIHYYERNEHYSWNTEKLLQTT